MNDPNDLNDLNEPNDLNDLNEPNDLHDVNVKHWYVVHTKPGNEHRVEANLSNQGIEVFLPLLETFQYSSGKMIQKIKPLFPNYLLQSSTSMFTTIR